MNKMISTILQKRINLKNSIHSNIYMVIGFYGIIAIFAICLTIQWLFHLELEPIFLPSLPPAWQNNGDINHILGTDSAGYDIFNYVLVSYQMTLILTVKVTFYVMLIGVVINYLLFFIPQLWVIIAIVFRLIIAIPPLLTTIIIAQVWGNNINVILLVIAISYLPRFVHNIHHKIMDEWQKTYIISHRLDGLSTPKILNFYILPNIFPAYLNEIISLFSQVILALTTLTFLGFGHNLAVPDLGTIMYQMLNIVRTNLWAFCAPGLIIIITIVFIHMFNLGIQLRTTKRVGN